MPSSSSSKSHKKSKHNSREYSDDDEDVKMKETNTSNVGKKVGVSIKVSRDSLVSGGKRKLRNDLAAVHGNDNPPEEYATPTKRRKEKTNGGEDKDDVNLDEKKLKVVGESKSKSSRKHDAYSANVDESKIGSQSKDNKGHNEWHVEEGMRNIELEKELEKRMRRRGEGYKNKDRYYDDAKEGDERIMSTYSSHVKDIKHKDEGYGVKYRETRHREDKSKDVKYKREREKDDRYYEDSKNDEKYYVDSDRDVKQRDKKYKESGGGVDRNGDKYRNKTGDQVVKHRDNKDDRSRDNDKDEGSDCKVRKVKDQNCESEKRFMSDDKVDQVLVNRDRHRSFANGKYNPIRDHHRVSKQEEVKLRDYNGNSNKDFTSANGQSNKITQKDDNCMNDNNLSQVDNDNLSISSPFTRNNHKSFFPPRTPFRTQNIWKNIPNWPFIFPNNNYIPFPPIFNPIMHQFTPPIFHQPLLQNWGANNSIFGNGSHGHGRVDWENRKSQFNNQVWEDTGVTVDTQSPIQKDEFLSEQIEIQVETMKNIPEVMKVKKEDDSHSLISRVYLSKIDISEDLTESDLYDQCTHMLNLVQESSVSDEFECKILFLEEGIGADVSNGDLLFGAINNSVFKKAMSLYTKQRGRNQEKGGDSGVNDSEVEDSGEKMDMNVDAGVKDSSHNCDGGKEVDNAAMMPELIQFESVNVCRIH